MRRLARHAGRAAFAVALPLWTALIGLGMPAALLSRRVMLALARGWNDGVLWLAKTLLNITLRFEEQVPLPPGPAVFAAKHQSALDTFSLWRRLENPAFVLKRELLDIPVFGWFLRRTGPIAIDRSAGRTAVQQIAEQGRARLVAGRRVVIFPEGTRRAPGAAPAYKTGGLTALYALGYPVIPVALNTGCCWPKRGPKRPGVCVIRFLEPLPPGLPREAMLAMLVERIESESDRLREQSGDTVWL